MRKLMWIYYFQLHQTQLITMDSPQYVDTGILEILKLATATKAK